LLLDNDRMKTFSKLLIGVAVLVALLVIIGDAPRAHATPEDAVRGLIKALEADDIDAVLFSLNRRVRKFAKKGRNGYDGLTRLAVKGLNAILSGGEVVGAAEIEGERATVRVKVGSVTMPIKCVKEGRGWKVATPL
jgi:hypothetical protein